MELSTKYLKEGPSCEIDPALSHFFLFKTNLWHPRRVPYPWEVGKKFEVRLRELQNLLPSLKQITNLSGSLILEALCTPNFPHGFSCEFVGIMLKNRCWPTTFHTITTGDADGWCQKWSVWSALARPLIELHTSCLRQAGIMQVIKSFATTRSLGDMMSAGHTVAWSHPHELNKVPQDPLGN